MAQCDCDGVRRIVGHGHLQEIQNPAGHVLHLMLGGVAVAHHRLLDLHGLLGIDGQPRLPDGQQDHPPALGDADAGGDILTEKQFFDGHGIGLR